MNSDLPAGGLKFTSPCTASPRPRFQTDMNMGNVTASTTVPAENERVERRAWTPERRRSARRPVLCPMFWREDELAAFVCCLSIGRETALAIRRRRLRGIDQIMQMSLHEEFGMSSIIERHVARAALKHFLELDRWQNEVQGRRLVDVLMIPDLG